MCVQRPRRFATSGRSNVQAEIQCEIADFEDDAGKLDQEVFGAGVDPFDRPLGEDEESDGEDGPDISFDDLSSDEGRDDAADENTETLRKEDEEIAPEVVSRLKDLAAKLDAVLKVIFEFLERMQLDGLSDEPPPPPSPPSDDEADARSAAERATVERRLRVFDVLIAIFERTILSTFKTQHTQFLLFWAASLDPALTGRFTYFLLERALYADDVPTVTRVASACYLASFISRAQFVDTTAARKVMAFLLEFVGHHLDDTSVDPARGGALVQQHAVFYAAVQAAFYIFCFRWRDLVVDEGELGRQWMPELSVLQRAVTSPYNPLKVRCRSRRIGIR
jgi:RNA polymerase I-specific transcription initiation factor RRN3